MRHLKIEASGIVQGVGFRPFVYRIANEHGIKGSVSNTPGGVRIHASGDGDQLYLFLRALKDEAPPQAVIEEVQVETAAPFSAASFEIIPSTGGEDRSVLISPDLATCGDCLDELLDAGDRRYRYPFINCTNCGPRFTIIRDTPYDRPNTSMAKFTMCPDCEKEYHDPADRRFHAQPNACPVCGPRLWLADSKGREIEGDAVRLAAGLLREGKIIAIKGLGGFQLACDATSSETVARLRLKKNRYGKPLAVMAGSVSEASEYCMVTEEEERLLSSPKSPIVLLAEKEGSPISREVAIGLKHQGIFLPYTPMHHLLLREVDFPLVMTSGNISSEPIAKDNEEALERLGGIADYLILHDRDILVRYDDSVARALDGAEYPVRRARGYAPYPIRVKTTGGPQVLALGAELKNTFCLLRGEHAFISQHIGDMESPAELDHFEEALEAVKRLFSLEPEVVAYDLHPDYMTTHMAMEMPLPRIGVQHHHAHVVGCMADNREEGKVIGVAWDGTGYGEDGTVWGGEFLLSDKRGFERLAHLYQCPMPGADACIYRIHRMAMGVLSKLFDDEEEALLRLRELMEIKKKEGASLVSQLRNKVNAPLTSSAGRMFDVAAALAGLRSEAQYDGQAACELEAVAVETGHYYSFMLDRSREPWVIDTRQLFREVLEDVQIGVDAGMIAGKFHETMARSVVETCKELSSETGIERVALSGGVFQNELLTLRVLEGLRAAGLAPLIHRRVPTNDGGVSLGQAIIAASRASRQRD
ncbi:MAG: carbamoyltransferase HypF [Actinobacteria bacterium]|nr:carbamoyltransferase HypF [Actinomycetota bacterium]